jgi:hypothetical protein
VYYPDCHDGIVFPGALCLKISPSLSQIRARYLSSCKLSSVGVALIWLCATGSTTGIECLQMKANVEGDFCERRLVKIFNSLIFFADL